ncbi:MAG: GGDEF domain-containing protein [Phycisphaerales bacterium]
MGATLDAVAMLAKSDLASAPDAVLVEATAVDEDPSEVVRAMRRIDPSVTLLLVTNGGATAELTHRALRAGFDGQVKSPVVRLELERALSEASWEPRDRPAAHESDTGNQSPTPSAPHESASAGAGGGGDEDRHRDGRALGDIDLIDQLLEDPDQFRPMLLEIIASHGRVETPDFVALDAAESQDGVVVRAGDTDLALLVGGASRESLERWGDWAGRWLALEDRLKTYRRLAYTDDLTGACNRRYFMEFLEHAVAEARARREFVTLMVYDIDNFKTYNDRFGHGAGDEILVETVRLLRSVIRPHDEVCRIGGDEFAIIFYDPSGQRAIGSRHPESIQDIARRFQNQIRSHRFPKLGSEAHGELTISGGLASFPWDGHDARSLLEVADHRALASKRAGKNAITFGPGGDAVASDSAE